MPNISLFLPIIEESTDVLYQSLNLPPYQTYNAEQRDELISRYWGDLETQYYPIGFQSIELMFDASFDKQTIALHVTNIRKRNKVNIEWIPVQQKRMGGTNIYDFALNISDTQHYYFILKRAYYDNLKLPDTNADNRTKGMKASKTDFGNVIAATLGRLENGDFCLFTNAATLTLIDGPDDGTGGNGYTPGAKIPSGA